MATIHALADPKNPRNADFLSKHPAIENTLLAIKNRICGRVDLNNARIADVINFYLNQAKRTFQTNGEYSVDAIVATALLRIEAVMDKNTGLAAGGSAVGETEKTKTDATAADKTSSNIFLLYISEEAIRKAERYYGKDREGLIRELAWREVAAKWGGSSRVAEARSVKNRQLSPRFLSFGESLAKGRRKWSRVKDGAMIPFWNFCRNTVLCFP